MGKPQFICVLIITAIFGFLGGVVSEKIFVTTPAFPDTSEGSSRRIRSSVIETQRIILKAEDGKTRATLGLSYKESKLGIVRLELFDPTGKRVIALGEAEEFEPSLALIDD